MRVALFGDIHGNCFAFTALLAALAAAAVDQLVCLGDVAIFGPQPQAALQQLQALGCPVVMGNTDAWALDPQPHPIRDAESYYFNTIEQWGASQLAAADRAYIRTFQPTVTLDLGGVTLLCYHGSPGSFHDKIVATTPAEVLAPLVGASSALVLAGGHTHEPYVRRYLDKILINPGSVGLPFERRADGSVRHPPWAEYALVTWAHGELQVELRRAVYASRALIAYTRGSQMPDAEWWLKDWLPGS